VTLPRKIELSAIEASELIQQELQEASHAFHTADLESALDRYIGALGLALQLGPAATERVLAGVMDAAREMAQEHNAYALSALGPALSGLANQVREEGALPPNAVMEAWAMVAFGLGTLLGQLGIVLAIAPQHRPGMLASAATRARLLDNTTGNRFRLAEWLKELSADLHGDEPGRSHPR